LEKLSFKVVKSGQDELRVTAPAWREDIAIPADIAEEIGRMFGWSKITPQRVYGELVPSVLPAEKVLERNAKRSLASLGYTETLSYSFYGASQLNKFGLHAHDHYRVLNPLNPEQEYMRTSLLPRLHDVILKNYQSHKSIKVFEVGRVFFKRPKGLPEEKKLLSILIYQKQGSMEAIKSVLQGLAFSLVMAEPFKLAPDANGMKRADIFCGQIKVGEIGEIAVSVDKLGIAPVYCTLFLDELKAFVSARRPFKPVPQFPSVERDVTFLASPDLDYRSIIDAVKKMDGVISDVSGGQFYRDSETTRSVTLHVVFQAEEHTLEAGEVDNIQKRIVSELKNKFGMELKK